MKNKDVLQKIMYWSPRIFIILFALFLSIFAFDVLGGDNPLSIKLIAFLIHLIPTVIMVGIIFISWKWELAGGILFMLLGIVFTLFFHTYQDIVRFTIVSFPVFLTGSLFLLSWKFSKKN